MTISTYSKEGHKASSLTYWIYVNEQRIYNYYFPPKELSKNKTLI